MNCELARQEIGPTPGPKPYSHVSEAASEHLAGCDACQEFYAAQRVGQDRVAARISRLQTASAPRYLRARIAKALADEARTERRHTRRLPLKWAASFAAAAAIAWFAIPRAPGADALASPLADAAREQLERVNMVETANTAEAEAWLERQVGYRVSVPDIGNAILIGAHVSVVGGQRLAAAVYLSRGMPVTYFAIPTGKLMGRRVEPNVVTAGKSNGYEVALWTEGGETRAIAAPMTRAEVIEMANECRSKSFTD